MVYIKCPALIYSSVERQTDKCIDIILSSTNTTKCISESVEKSSVCCHFMKCTAFVLRTDGEKKKIIHCECTLTKRLDFSKNKKAKNSKVVALRSQHSKKWRVIKTKLR